MDPRPFHFQYRKPRFSNPTYQSGSLYQSIYHMGKMFPSSESLHNKPSYKLPSGYDGRNAQKQKQIQEMVEQRLRQREKQQSQNYINSERKNSQRDINQNMGRFNKNQDYTKQEYRNIRQQNKPPREQYPQYNNLVNERRNSYDHYEQQRKYSNERQYGRNSQRSDKNGSSREANQGYYPPEHNYNHQKRFQQRSQSQQLSQKPRRAVEQNYMSNYGNRLMRPMPGKDQDRIYEHQQKPYNIISCYPNQAPPLHRQYPKLTLEDKLIETGQYMGQSQYNPQK